MSEIIKPHGGHLVNLILAPEESEAAKARSRELKQIALNGRTVSDLELLAVGAFSPLEGFMGKKDYESVVYEMRLSSGLPWTLPITLAVSSGEATEIREGEEIALVDSSGEASGHEAVEEERKVISSL